MSYTIQNKNCITSSSSNTITYEKKTVFTAGAKLIQDPIELEPEDVTEPDDE